MNPSEKRPLAWENFRGPRGLASLLVATALGAGFTPRAPGTMGALVGLPLAYFTADWALAPRIAIAALLLTLGTWASLEWTKRARDGGDDQRIVIDEVLGVFVTALPLSRDSGPSLWIAAFVLFRFFDIVKPWPVRSIDRWSKNRPEPWAGAFGVMADDLVAGLQGLLALWLLTRFF